MLEQEERTLMGFGGGERQPVEAGGGGEEKGAGEGGESGKRGWCWALPAAGHAWRRRGGWRRPAEEAAALKGKMIMFCLAQWKGSA